MKYLCLLCLVAIVGCRQPLSTAEAWTYLESVKIADFTLKNANRTEAIEHLARLVIQAEKEPQIHIIIDSKDELWEPDTTRTDWHLRGASAADIARMMTTQYTFQWKYNGSNLVAIASRDQSAN